MKEKKEKGDFYSPVIITQIVLCVILILSVFFFKNDGLKADFRRIMENNITTEDFSSLVSLLKSELSLPVDGFSASEEETLPEETTEEPTEEETTKAEITEEEITEEETTEKETTEEAKEVAAVFSSGGEDKTKEEAPSHCTYEPLEYKEKILNPIKAPRYTSEFGYRENPITGEYGFHTGLDIAAKKGTKIRAAYKGEVTKTGEDSRAGKYIFLTHEDGVVTFYCHCSEIKAKLGDTVKRGETIALVGSTGQSTGPHLHFEVRKNDIRFDPMRLLENANQV